MRRGRPGGGVELGRGQGAPMLYVYTYTAYKDLSTFLIHVLVRSSYTIPYVSYHNHPTFSSHILMSFSSDLNIVHDILRYSSRLLLSVCIRRAVLLHICIQKPVLRIVGSELSVYGQVYTVFANTTTHIIHRFVRLTPETYSLPFTVPHPVKSSPHHHRTAASDNSLLSLFV